MWQFINKYWRIGRIIIWHTSTIYYKNTSLSVPCPSWPYCGSPAVLEIKEIAMQWIIYLIHDLLTKAVFGCQFDIKEHMKSKKSPENRWMWTSKDPLQKSTCSYKNITWTEQNKLQTIQYRSSFNRSQPHSKVSSTNSNFYFRDKTADRGGLPLFNKKGRNKSHYKIKYL